MTSSTSIAAVLVLLVSAYFGGTAAGPEEYEKSKETCGKLLRVPSEDLQKYLRSEFPENHETFCYIRCVAILPGHYSDEQGLLVDNLYEAYNLGKSKEEYTELVNECQAQVGEDVSCYCHKAFIPLMCMRKHYYEWKKTVTSDQQA